MTILSLSELVKRAKFTSRAKMLAFGTALVLCYRKHDGGGGMSLIDKIGGLDSGLETPLYHQLRKAIRQAIENNVLRPEDPLPPERDLAEQLAVSRITVRKALDGLVADGLLTRRQGAGTFVARRVEKSFSMLSSFTEDMAARGRTSHSKWLSRSEGAVTPDESLMLGLSPGTRVYRFNRVRYSDDEPMALEQSTISGFCLASADDVGESLYEALDAAGCRPTRALQRLRAVLFSDAQAALLGIQPGSPGLFIERRAFLEDGRAVETTQSYYRGDAYDFVAELNG
jgi:GntR family transcriptional regulator